MGKRYPPGDLTIVGKEQAPGQLRYRFIYRCWCGSEGGFDMVTVHCRDAHGLPVTTTEGRMQLARERHMQKERA